MKRVFNVYIEKRRVLPLNNMDKNTFINKIKFIKSIKKPLRIFILKNNLKN